MPLDVFSGDGDMVDVGGDIFLVNAEMFYVGGGMSRVGGDVFYLDSDIKSVVVDTFRIRSIRNLRYWRVGLQSAGANRQ